jgi:hypothetical protein
MPAQRQAKSCPILDDFEQFWVLFAWQQRFESLALGFESSRSPAKFAKRFESSNPDSRIRLTTSVRCVLTLHYARYGLNMPPRQNMTNPIFLDCNPFHNPRRKWDCNPLSNSLVVLD